MPDDPATPEHERDEALLERLRELMRRRDPVPDRVSEAARSAAGERGRGGRGRADGELTDDD